MARITLRVATVCTTMRLLFAVATRSASRRRVSLPPILNVAAVQARYGMKDERTARRLMNQIGAFKVGGHL